MRSQKLSERPDFTYFFSPELLFLKKKNPSCLLFLHFIRSFDQANELHYLSSYLEPVPPLRRAITATSFVRLVSSWFF